MVSTSFNTRSRAAWTTNLELIFLVGSPRSGTTWLQAMLSCHPAVCTGPETFFFATFSEAEKEFLRPKERRIGLAEYLSQEEFYRVIGELFWLSISALPEAPAGTKYFLEKTTNHCVYSEFILKTFPRARFIHIIRDPRAVVASILRAAKSWGNNWAPTDVREATRIWSTLIQYGRGIRNLVGNPDQYLEVKYEDLRVDTRKHLSKLLSWLGLDATNDVIAEIIEANSLQKTRIDTQKFSSIPMTPMSAVSPISDTPYPPGFVGPAPGRAEDVELSWLECASVETMVSELLTECGYARTKRCRLPGERFAIVLADVLLRRSSLFAEKIVKIFGKGRSLRF